ncbi:MAG: hypothetical protein O2857_23085, partial [Planctomycetota bacterium]|nr:hypothetical protein [Planctomycetota bacterium]
EEELNLKEQEELAEEELLDKLKERLEEIVEDELEPEDEDQLVEEIDEIVEENFEQALEEKQVSELTQDEIGKVEEEVLKKSLDELDLDLTEMRKEAILAEVRRYVRDEVAPALKQRIETELEKRTGKVIDQELKKAVQAQRSERIADATKKLDAARSALKNLVKQQTDALDSAQKDTASMALNKVKEQVRQTIENEVRDKAVPKVAKQITDKVKGELSQVGWEEDKFSTKVEKEIIEALNQEMSGKSKVNPSVAAKPAEASFSADKKSQGAEDAAEQTKARLESALGEEQAAKAVESAAQAVASKAQASAAESVSKGSERATTRQSALSADGRSRVSKLSDLKGKLSQISKNAAEGRQIASASDGSFQLTQGEPSDQSESSEKGLQKAEGIAEAEAGEGESSKAALGEGAAETTGEGTTQEAVLGEGAAKLTDDGDGKSEGLDEGASKLTGKSGGTQGQPLGEGAGPGDGKVASASEPVGIGYSFAGRSRLGFNAHAKENREVYKLFREFKKVRKEGLTPIDADYGHGVPVTGVAANPVTMPTERAALVFVESPDSLATSSKSNTDGLRRQVPKPQYNYLAFGAAEYQQNPLTVDGDLGDWGELRHPMPMQWSFNDERLTDGLPIFMRWSRNGFYFCYRVPNRTKVDLPKGRVYEGDLFEVWLDVDNLRKASMQSHPFSQQFTLMPFGFNGNPEASFSEIGRGFRGILMHAYRLEASPEINTALGKCRGRIHDGGYTVEGFISIKALANPKVKAGMYVAMNFSINRGFDYARSQQWSLSKNTKTGGYNRPDTWGDVLLLGTDANSRFVDAKGASSFTRAVVPGEPIGIEVTDADMNTNGETREHVLASVRLKGSASSMYVILRETGSDTGIFRGSFQTQPHYLPNKSNTLNVRGGQKIQLFYKDARSAYGEPDRRVEAEMEIGLPVFQISKN